MSCCAQCCGLSSLFRTKYKKRAQCWFQPLPIAWVVAESVDGTEVLETASCFYNFCADGGDKLQGHVPMRQRFAPVLAIGLQACSPIVGLIRARREAVVQTASWENRVRLHRLLNGAVAKVPGAELVSAPGVTVRRISSAPIAFSCAFVRELDLGHGRNTRASILIERRHR